jgi:hypothetical protein
MSHFLRAALAVLSLAVGVSAPAFAALLKTRRRSAQRRKPRLMRA